MTIGGGVAAAAAPTAPGGAHLDVLSGNVIRITAFYLATPDGANRATQWAIAYTTDGSTPPINTPGITVDMSTGAMQVLQYSLPAVAPGVTVKVQLQVRRTTPSNVYSTPLAVLTAQSTPVAPSPPVDLQAWPGEVPSDF